VIALQRHLEPGLKWGLRLGMAVSLAGMALGFLMTVPTAAQQQALDAGQQVNMIGAHSVGVPDGGRGMPLTGWATTGGDLRIPHFVGLHALQVLPLLALALVALSRRSPRFADSRVRAQLVTIAAAGYAGLVGLLTWQALRGQPLIHPDGITLAAFAGLVGIVGLAAGLRLRTPVAVRSAEPVAVSR
jgi:hypothetical protein